MTAAGLTATGSGTLPMQLQGFSTSLQRPCTPISQTKTLSWARECCVAWSSHAQTMWALELHLQSLGH